MLFEDDHFSTKNQKLRDEIQNFANSKNLGELAFIEENISGMGDLKKRELYKVLKQPKDGDNLIVSDVTRLSRSSSGMREVFQIIKNRGVNLHVAKDD